MAAPRFFSCAEAVSFSLSGQIGEETLVVSRRDFGVILSRAVVF
jgi:hypothetical protein